MAALATATPGRGAGSDLVGGLVNAAAGGDTFIGGPNVYLRVKSTKVGVLTVTITPPAGTGPLGTTIAPVALSPTVEASTGDRIYGPFPTSPFADSTGAIAVSYSPAPSGSDTKVQVFNFSG
jgi:hypothetical protein